ncbi:HK97 gp10 family phage protein, putative [Babesia ovis]|uniref:HK97 gp10 family phage protein, putative n=1 Tax=Babesia ovis TaxID=5869 RepID=A0A9W5T8C5_BABOV|nr:HK97 gp10 family phage protein, putative [Babesia ovis]
MLPARPEAPLLERAVLATNMFKSDVTDDASSLSSGDLGDSATIVLEGDTLDKMLDTTSVSSHGETTDQSKSELSDKLDSSSDNHKSEHGHEDWLTHILDGAKCREKRDDKRKPEDPATAALYAKGGLVKRAKTAQPKVAQVTVGDSGRGWRERIQMRRQQLGDNIAEPVPTRQQRMAISDEIPSKGSMGPSRKPSNGI